MRRLLIRTVAGLALALAAAAPVAAHSQVVTSPGAGVVVAGPISKPYAQAHCHSAAPGVVAEASKGVVVFNPQAALPCPAVLNPGGQVTGR